MSILWIILLVQSLSDTSSSVEIILNDLSRSANQKYDNETIAFRFFIFIIFHFKSLLRGSESSNES